MKAHMDDTALITAFMKNNNNNDDETFTHLHYK